MALLTTYRLPEARQRSPSNAGGYGRRRAREAFWRHGGMAPLRLLLALTIGVFGLFGARAETSISLEYQVKAAFMYNFAKYVEWPPKSFPEADRPFVIGLIGEDPFGAELDQMLKNKKVNERQLVIKRCKQLNELKSCHLVFISRSERGRVDEILRALIGTSVLTVSDMDDFASHGGIIDFAIEDGKVRFDINLASAERSELKISSKLLKLARNVFSKYRSGSER